MPLFFPQLIAERKIQEAIRNGEFDNLPGKGKPLVLEDDRGIPEELRLAYKILKNARLKDDEKLLMIYRFKARMHLKNADCLPPELELKKEICGLKELLAGMTDVEERMRLVRKVNFQIMKLNLMRRVSPLLEENQVYYEKILAKLADGREEK